MSFDRDTIRLALTRVAHPSPAMRGRDIVSLGAVGKIAYCDGYASIRIAGAGLHDDQKRGLMQQASAAVRLAAQQAGVELADVHVEVTDEPVPGPPPGPPPASGHRPIPVAAPEEGSSALASVKHIVAVGAGKGGVGKSTIAVNLAVGLARRGHAVGIMDGDIYGPSLPTMLGLGSLDAIVRGRMIQPFFVHGVKAMTIGKMVDPEKPLIWRGPMAHGAFKQIAEQTEWGELDYLIIDLPPGTGDVSLTMAQTLKVDGAVVVCTPQQVAQDDAIRALRMFQQFNIEVLGVVENMSYFIGDDGVEYDLFGRGGAELMAQRTGVPFLGAIPINIATRMNSDRGDPSANFTDRSTRNAPLAEALERLVTNVENQIALAGLKSGARQPQLKIS